MLSELIRFRAVRLASAPVAIKTYFPHRLLLKSQIPLSRSPTAFFPFTKAKTNGLQSPRRSSVGLTISLSRHLHRRLSAEPRAERPPVINAGILKESKSVRGTTCCAVSPKVITLIHAVSRARGSVRRSAINCCMMVFTAWIGSPAIELETSMRRYTGSLLSSIVLSFIWALMQEITVVETSSSMAGMSDQLLHAEVEWFEQPSQRTAK